MTAHQALNRLASQLFDLSANLTAQAETLENDAYTYRETERIFLRAARDISTAATLAGNYADTYRDLTI